MAYIKHEDILLATTGGLDIILSYYPQAREALEKNDKRFKIRDEKTPSAAIKKLPDGNYVVTDFGNDQTPRNAINICMLEENVTYREAIVILADKYGIGGITAEINKPIFEIRPATAEEIDGEYSFSVKDDITESELKVLGPLVTEEVCKKYHVNSLLSFTYIKDRKAHVTQSTDNYPIFLFNDSNKIYSPLNPEKGYRFRYVGKKEKDFVNGLAQLSKAYENHREQQLKEDDEEKTIDKLPEAILCSGERDALNIAGHGYFPVWLNSETTTLTGKNFSDIIRCVDTIYNLPDIDATGIKAAIRLGMFYLDIKIALLPPELSTYRDNRGKPRKDLLDYVELYPKRKDFKKLLDVAKPLRFWDIVYTKDSMKYKFNSAHALFFLWANGFGKLEDKNSKEGSIIIQVDGNVVKEINPRDVKSYFLEFREKRYLPIPVENMIHDTPSLSEDRLRGLKKRNIDFSDFDNTSQYLFFANGSIKVDKNNISQFKPGELDRYTWEEKVIPHRFKLLDNFFNIKKVEGTELYDIETLEHNSHFFNYLTNASRIHWQKELEEKVDLLSQAEKAAYLKEHKFSVTGPLLSPEEIAEQKQHLVNKIFSIGYLLHQYKNKARPWAIYAVDSKLASNDESCGGSGKSFCYSALNIFKKSVTLPGRDARLTENPHVYDRVNEYTDFVLVDDCEKYLKFNFFFDALTGVLSVNPKMNKSYEIPFPNSPKFCFTSNYMLKNPDPSTLRRVLFTVFSDYYHEKTEYSSYRETRKIADDFGKQLFDDYNDEEWNNDLNFFAQCIKFYLSIPSPQKIEPPMGNVILRNLLAEMGETFKDWAEVYFAPDGDNADKLTPRDEALDDFVKKTNSNKWTTNKFSKALKSFCRYYGYDLNPNNFLNAQGRIIRKIKGKATDMIYVQTKSELNPIDMTDEVKIKEEDKLF
jgi:hypothetical protein